MFDVSWTAAMTGPFAWLDYWRDAGERWVLVLDALRRRADNAAERMRETAPHVLSFDAELLIDGRTLPNPVNYGLVRIVPPADVSVDPRKRPFIVFDPRAGHGPGIGGMKSDSEIGVALRAGHPCYFVGFLPAPVPGQQVAHVCAAEAIFVQAVRARHPEAEGRPVLIGNCQAGWQVMMMAALNPDLPGPIMLVGSPLAYWAGVHGRNPLRYLGGVLGGSWMTALLGDLGNGLFDGANLVANFEAMNPANTLWKKPYDLYAKVDTEAQRFLEFEKWWGTPVLLNAAEMQTIVDDLFVGNKLAAGQMQTPDGLRIDLRNIHSPIIVFCSWGDDITPPQQALHWILDLYENDADLVAAGQTIVYCLHQSIGHLGIFVSGRVATKEHEEFAQAMSLIDLAPPGLYEAVISGVEEGMDHGDLIRGSYLFQLERRSLGDLRALGGNDAADDLRFATAARVSEINLGLYQAVASPVVRAASSEMSAEALRQLHPLRLRFQLFSSENPFMKGIAERAQAVREHRHPASPSNPFKAIERQSSDWIIATLQAMTAARDQMQEAAFLSVYGSPVLQAAVGLRGDQAAAGRRIARDLGRDLASAKLNADLAALSDQGGAIEAAVRAMLYIRMEEGRTDERAFAALEQAAADWQGPRVGFSRLKEIVHKQYLMLLHDPGRAIATLPRLLPADRDERKTLLKIVQRIVTARGALSGEAAQRMRRIKTMFEPDSGKGRVIENRSEPSDGDRHAAA